MQLSIEVRGLVNALTHAGALPEGIYLLAGLSPIICASMVVFGATIWVSHYQVGWIEWKWVWSPRVDVMTFVAPVCAAFAWLPTVLFIRSDEVPLWCFLPLVVLGDIMHIWATLLRTYLDTGARDKRGRLFFLSPPALLLFGFCLHAWSEVLHASFVSYVAIYHFVSQNYGFLAIYKARVGERFNMFDYRLDYWTLMMAALGPVLIWHATPTRRFSWFGFGEEFLIRLPESYQPLLYVMYISMALGWLGRQCYVARTRSSPLNGGKLMIMGLSWLTWAVAIFNDHAVVSLAFMNLFHGIPFFVIVWNVARARHKQQDADSGEQPHLGISARAMRAMTEGGGRGARLYLTLLLCLGAAESLMWELLVVKEYHQPEHLWPVVQWMSPELEGWQRSFAVALVNLPQMVHFFLDAFIWKMDGSNPGLREAIFPAEKIA